LVFRLRRIKNGGARKKEKIKGKIFGVLPVAHMPTPPSFPRSIEWGGHERHPPLRLAAFEAGGERHNGNSFSPPPFSCHRASRHGARFNG